VSTEPPARPYIHGTDAAEQERLARMNDFVNQACLRELSLHGGERLLDVGSGLGQFTRLLARTVGPKGRVVGVEGDPRQLGEAQRLARAAGEEGLADLRAGDAFNLPLRPEEWGQFDVAHTRFLLEHVRDPLGVVRRMVRTVRPGGRVVLADDDHDVLRLWPEPPGFRPMWEAYARTYDRLGNDPYVGRRLVALLHAAGTRPGRNTWVFFGSCAGHPTFEAVVANLLGIFAGARAQILAFDLIDAAVFDDGLRALEAWGRRPDAAFWYAIAWAEGTVPSP
jgi:SAM-dependent methyltransferase